MKKLELVIRNATTEPDMHAGQSASVAERKQDDEPRVNYVAALFRSICQFGSFFV